MIENIDLSVIVPAYNEEDIIKDTLRALAEYLSKKKYVWEIVVVSDGSIDKTDRIVEKIAKKDNKIRLINPVENRGKGAALRKGFLDSKGKYRIFTDADLSVSVTYIDQIYHQLKKGSKVVIASRRVPGAMIEVHQPWHREMMGRVYTYLSKVVTGVDVADFTCGMKGFEKGAANKIFGKSKIDRWAYDSEVLFLAKKYGYAIDQLPIRWVNREDTRVHLSGVVWESFKDLLQIRVNDANGLY